MFWTEPPEARVTDDRPGCDTGFQPVRGALNVSELSPRRTVRLIATALLAAAVVPPVAAGCANRRNARGGPAAGPATQPAMLVPSVPAAPPTLFRTPGQPNSFHLDVYQVAVPIGAVSDSPDFWRRVDEERIDPATKDLLLKNGLRAGTAASDDWEFFRALIERHPHFTRSGSAVATGTGAIELPMRKNVPTQDIWLYRGQYQLAGRTYDRCDDLIGVSFWPDPRRADEMRISISPTIRSTRARLEVNRNNEELHFVERRPEFLYELNLRTVVPTDRFLVLGLSPEGRRPSSLGHQFLTIDEDVERKEQVLVFVPRLRNRQAPAATQATPEIDAAASRPARD